MPLPMHERPSESGKVYVGILEDGGHAGGGAVHGLAETGDLAGDVDDSDVFYFRESVCFVNR